MSKKYDLTLDEPYRLILESSSDGIIIVNGKGDIVFANSTALETFGYQKDELLGGSHDILVPERLLKLHRSELKNYFSNPIPRLMGRGLELTGRRKDGTEFPVDINLIPVEAKNELLVISVVRDITARKREENLLNESRERYRILAEASQDFIFIIDVNETIKYMNYFAADYLGLPVGNLIGKPFSKLPAEIYKPLRLIIQKAIKKGKPISSENKIVFPKAEVWLDTKLIPLKDSNGGISAVMGVARDITKNRLAEERLLDEKQKLETVTGFTNCALFLLDDQTRVSYANRVAQEWFGPLASIGGKFCWEVFSLTNPEKECAGYEVVRTGRAVRRETYARLTAKKEQRYVFLDASPIKDEKGKIQQVIEMVVDITEHKQMEDRLRSKTLEALRQNKITSNFMNVLEITGTSMNFHASLNRLLPFINGLLENESCMIYSVDLKKSLFKPSHQLGLPSSSLIYFSATASNTDKSKIPPVVLYRDIRSFTDINKVMPELPESLQALLKMIKSKSILIIPLTYENEMVAVLFCAYKKKTDFTKKIREIANKLRKHLEAFYISHMHTLNLLRETMRLTEHAEMVEAMSGIDSAILASTTEEEMIQAVLVHLGNVINSEIIEILRYDAAAEKFVPAACIEKNIICYDRESYGQKEVKSWNDVLFGVPAYYPYLSQESIINKYEKKFIDKGVNSLLLIPLLVKDELIGAIAFGNTRTSSYSPKNLAIAQRLSNQIAVALSNAGLIKQLQDLLIGVVRSLVTAIDAKSPWTKGHSDRVSDTSVRLGKYLGLSENELYDLRLAALFHDAGKIGTYDVVLDKAEKLKKSELDLIKKHPQKTYEIIYHIPKMRYIAQIALHHHERWDGKGYPDGLADDDIPYLSRIIAVADTYDALISDRPYRNGLSIEEALEEMAHESGVQLDPEVTEIFIDVTGRKTKLRTAKQKRRKAA